jgi:hypothetical protein
MSEDGWIGGLNINFRMTLFNTKLLFVFIEINLFAILKHIMKRKLMKYS